VTGRRGRRSKQPLEEGKETRRYWILKDETLARTVWRTGCGKGRGAVVRANLHFTLWMCIEDDSSSVKVNDECWSVYTFQWLNSFH